MTEYAVSYQRWNPERDQWESKTQRFTDEAAARTFYRGLCVAIYGQSMEYRHAAFRVDPAPEPEPEPLPEGASAHSVVFTYEDGYIRSEMKCRAPEGAHCRLESDCDCDSWIIEQADNGQPFHRVETYGGSEVIHWMRDSGECVVSAWMDVEQNGHGTFTIAEVPAEIIYEYDAPAWKKAEA